jgi:feruloyl esterase
MQGYAPAGTTIDSADVVAATATVPQYCLVKGTTPTVNNSITWAVGLPTAWNDKLYWGAQGGFAGSAPVPPALGLQQGYVSGITDTGHRSVGTDGSWALNSPDKVIDFGHRGIKASVDVGKAMVAGYYQSPIKRSIMASCSNGGRATMIHSQRYPKDFDGYVVTAPAFDWAGQVVVDFYHGSSSFFAKPGSWLPPAKIKLLSDAYLAACDASDGLVDGIVSDPRSCKIDPRLLQCAGGDGPACLTKDQTDAVVRFTSEMKNKFGEVVSPPWLLTGDEGNPAGIPAWKTGNTAPPVDANGAPKPPPSQAAGHGFMVGTLTGIVYNDANYDWRKFDVDNDENFLAQVQGSLSAVDTNLMPTVSRGAKFLFLHGWSDQALNPLRTIGYWDAVVARYGKEKTDSFLRLFLVPGMQHCGGGTNATSTYDALGVMEKWLDTGKAPDVMEASYVESGVKLRTRPLCAHPKVIRFAAYNFFCVDPS